MTGRQSASPKQHARIWFEFYKLALNDSELGEEVERSRSFYRPWGEVAGRKFNDWWRDHAHLFEAGQVSKGSAVRSDDNALYVRIPIGMSATSAAAQVRQLLLADQQRWSAERGVAVLRGARVGGARFKLTDGVRFAGRSADLSLRLYRDIYIPAGKPPIGEAFANEVARYFRENPRVRMTPIYLARNHEGAAGDEVLRSLRRSIERAKALTASAARGDFPGRL